MSCVCVCVHVYVLVCICIHMYIYIYIQHVALVIVILVYGTVLIGCCVFRVDAGETLQQRWASRCHGFCVSGLAVPRSR